MVLEVLAPLVFKEIVGFTKGQMSKDDTNNYNPFDLSLYNGFYIKLLEDANEHTDSIIESLKKLTVVIAHQQNVFNWREVEKVKEIDYEAWESMNDSYAYLIECKKVFLHSDVTIDDGRILEKIIGSAGDFRARAVKVKVSKKTGDNIMDAELTSIVAKVSFQKMLLTHRLSIVKGGANFTHSNSSVCTNISDSYQNK